MSVLHSVRPVILDNHIAGVDNPIAVLQLASPSHIVVIHVSKWDDSSMHKLGCISALKTILECSQIKKVGVGILGECASGPLEIFSDAPRGDARKIWQDLGIVMRGCVDLDRMLGAVDPESHQLFTQHPIGLSSMCEMYTRLHLEKEQSIRTGNWEKDLSKEQLECESRSCRAGMMAYLYQTPQMMQQLPSAFSSH